MLHVNVLTMMYQDVCVDILDHICFMAYVINLLRKEVVLRETFLLGYCVGKALC